MPGRNETEDEQASVGEHFTDEGEEWIVLDVGWEAKAKEVVVWYYRADCKKGDEELREDIDQPEIEHSPFEGVEQWINESRK
jgi:hypothetical protein